MILIFIKVQNYHIFMDFQTKNHNETIINVFLQKNMASKDFFCNFAC